MTVLEESGDGGGVAAAAAAADVDGETAMTDGDTGNDVRAMAARRMSVGR